MKIVRSCYITEIADILCLLMCSELYMDQCTTSITNLHYESFYLDPQADKITATYHVGVSLLWNKIRHQLIWDDFLGYEDCKQRNSEIWLFRVNVIFFLVWNAWEFV